MKAESFHTSDYPGDTMTRILIVDDDVLMRQLMIYILSKVGYQVLEAGTGRAGVDIAKSQSPTLILLDLMLPLLNGFEVLSELRRFPSTAQTPIIVVTGSTDILDTERALRMGANNVITKPFLPRQLIESIKQELNHTGVH